MLEHGFLSPVARRCHRSQGRSASVRYLSAVKCSTAIMRKKAGGNAQQSATGDRERRTSKDARATEHLFSFRYALYLLYRLADLLKLSQKG